MTDWDQLKDCARGDSSVVADWHRIVEEGKSREQRWIEKLRAQGFKAAHPNDGWVDREKNTITFCYPQFNDGAKVGDKVMLGWAVKNGRSLRPVRLIAETPFGFSLGDLTPKFTFEDLT